MSSQRFDEHDEIARKLMPNVGPIVWAIMWTGVLLGYGVASGQALMHPGTLVLSLVIGGGIYTAVCAYAWYRVWSDGR